jgi:hypothetical protein
MPFTANEILEYIQELGFAATLKIDHRDSKDECTFITITTEEELEWYIYLGFTGPYFDEFEISSHLHSSENPHLEANNWNKFDHESIVIVYYDEETGNPAYSNGYFTLQQRMKCMKGDLSLEAFVESSLLLWEDEFDEFIAQLCPEISFGQD